MKMADILSFILNLKNVTYSNNSRGSLAAETYILLTNRTEVTVEIQTNISTSYEPNGSL